MIRINLLPAEKRKAERTPLPRFFLILTNVAALSIIGLYLAYVWFQIRQTEDDIRSATATLQSLQPAVAEHDRLQQEVAALQAKVREIDSVTERPIEWWQAINAVWDVIHQHPKVWIDDLRVLDDKQASSDIKRMDPATKIVPVYGIALKCHVAGSEVEEMTRFRKGLKDHPVLQRTLAVLNFDVDWKVDKET
ncbi:MAG TPA: hypothetical protein VEJ18_12445, partial [Planctomycetota bacterium]|nr:hypothetical protein [Planctomycetota bacterium]